MLDGRRRLPQVSRVNHKVRFDWSGEGITHDLGFMYWHDHFTGGSKPAYHVVYRLEECAECGAPLDWSEFDA